MYNFSDSEGEKSRTCSVYGHVETESTDKAKNITPILFTIGGISLAIGIGVGAYRFIKNKGKEK